MQQTLAGGTAGSRIFCTYAREALKPAPDAAEFTVSLIRSCNCRPHHRAPHRGTPPSRNEEWTSRVVRMSAGMPLSNRSGTALAIGLGRACRPPHPGKCVEINVPVAICIERDEARRPRRVGSDVIYGQHRQASHRRRSALPERRVITALVAPLGNRLIDVRDRSLILIGSLVSASRQDGSGGHELGDGEVHIRSAPAMDSKVVVKTSGVLPTQYRDGSGSSSEQFLTR
jgi:hypothetical protein